jgi:hypothetical protein
MFAPLVALVWLTLRGDCSSKSIPLLLFFCRAFLGLHGCRYIVTTGAAFGLLALAHIARLFEEGAHLITRPVFLLTTVGSASVCAWAMILLKSLSRAAKSELEETTAGRRH